MNDLAPLDLTIDGADELDGALDLVKGGGGALLREKIVAAASARMVVIADGSKRVARLGAFPLPVEVAPFGWRATLRLLAEATGREATLRGGDGAPFVTDGGNHVLDLAPAPIADAAALSARINAVPGVVDNGLFVGLCHAAVIGAPDGSAEVIERP